MLGEVQEHVGLEGDAPRSEALMDSLGSEADLAEDPQLVPSEGELGVLQISHLDAEIPHDVVVNEGRTGCWKVWRHQTSEGSPFDTENKF